MIKGKVEEIAKEYSTLSYHEIINREELQRLQNELCQLTGIFAYCVDEYNEKLTDFSGNPDEINLLKEYYTEEQIKYVLERVSQGTIEEQVVEDLSVSNIKIAAVSIRVQDRPFITWVVFGVLSDGVEYSFIKEETSEFKTVITSVQFYQVLDFIRAFCDTLFINKLSCFNAEARSRRSHYAELEMSQNLRTMESVTEMVQLLDSNEQIEVILKQFLNILGNQLKLTHGQLLQVYSDDRHMDVMMEWSIADGAPFFRENNKIPSFQFINSEKPIIFSSNSIVNSKFMDEIETLDIKAIALFPVLKQQNGDYIYLNLIHKNQKHIWNMQEVKFIGDAVKILKSILHGHNQKKTLAGSYKTMEAILDSLGNSIFIRDVKTGKPLFTNRKLKNTFAKELQEGTFHQIIDLKEPLNCDGDTYEINHILRNSWYNMINSEISWVDGRKVSVYALNDITDKKNYQKRVEQQAYTDFLTGLYNRMCCERDLAWHIKEAKSQNKIGALLYLDLDDFKHINDGLGHQYGDVLLKSISNSLRRVEEIHNTCYRMGGDEFVIIIPATSYSKLDSIVDNINYIFSKPWYLKDADYYCTMSAGIVTFPDDGDSVQDLIKKADIAMYEAKKSGKNRTAKYSSNINSLSRRRLDMEKNMRDATVGGYKEFEVHYQPVIDVQNEEIKCTGAEALIRWNSTKLGSIPPSEFIPLAEYLGLINPIGNYVLKEACRCCKEWNDNGYPDYKVNVNLSVVQLLQADIVDIVDRTIKETGLKPENLALEVTESLAINDMERMKEILYSIKELGVLIALDDFGTGYSSLNHIREIPFDIIKVDRSFVRDLTEDAYSQSFVKMVAELAEALGASICIEGVETLEQYKILQDIKVKYIQGYYFDRPMPREQFEKKYTPVLSS